MEVLAIIAVAIGLSMDAFAVSVVTGAAYPSRRGVEPRSDKELHYRHTLRMAGFFGGFQAFMPAVGYLAGHTHGGQIALPFYGAVITLSKFGKKYESGMYKVANIILYVNRGIGMDGGPSPRARFLARPEITVFEIHPPGWIKPG